MDAQETPIVTPGQRKWRNGHKRVLDVLATGGTYTDAAEAAGIERKTVWDWRAKDPDFAEACEAARLEGRGAFRAAAEDYIKRAIHPDAPISPPGVTAALKTLGALDGSTWSEKVRNEHTGPDGGPIVTEVQRIIVRAKDTNG